MSGNSTQPELNFCTTIIANPDISGIGIRISIYVGTIISLLLSLVMSDARNVAAINDIYQHTVFTSTGLIISAIIQWKTQGLSLFDGLIVTMLTSMMVGSSVVDAYKMHSVGLTGVFTHLLNATFTSYWGIQVWQNPSTFGIPLGGENCTASVETIFVVFGKNVQVTNSKLRGFALFVFGWSTTAIPMLLVGTILCVVAYAYVGLGGHEDPADRGLAIGSQYEEARPYKRFSSAKTSLAVIIYMIVTIEQMVHRNNVQAQLSTWTFGQTLALMVLLQQIMAAISLCKQESQD
ncbi:hypothetical protein RSOLAG22IIIB_05930 [Rhizoctonia solani]|uniref:Transmembrane protein n=1 Tax=Rhizoctonia solani TaxID=456999 RepID=A0A0K6GA98_9AGAM|nr:hypothetical protein RSOLAG22IIIB_05930 [Rhizoctonia solani]